MKCCICGKEFDGYGNNPDPICGRDDYKSLCCDSCNSYVIQARMLELNKTLGPIKPGDLICIFWSTNSDKPIETILESHKFLAGNAREQIKTNQWAGNWGNFILDTETDSYIIIKDTD